MLCGDRAALACRLASGAVRGESMVCPWFPLKWHIVCELVERHLVGSRACSSSQVEHRSPSHARTDLSIHSMKTEMIYQAFGPYCISPTTSSPPWADVADLVVFERWNAHYATFTPQPPLTRKSQGHFKNRSEALETLQACPSRKPSAFFQRPTTCTPSTTPSNRTTVIPSYTHTLGVTL